MRRFFVDDDARCDDALVIQGELAHHMKDVLRMDAGEEAEFVLSDDKLYHGRLVQLTKTQVTVKLLSSQAIAAETNIQVSLFQGLPKGDKMDFIIQKCTELGVARIVPIVTKRTVVRLDEAKGAKKVGRWQKIAQEASQQAKRLRVPEVLAPLSWQDFLDDLSADDLTIVLWEDEVAQGFKALLQSLDPLPKRLNLLIGPEGGWDETEIEDLQQKGVHSVTLGKRILRTETAGLAALTMVLYQSGDLG